jgi:hypothetical protein
LGAETRRREGEKEVKQKVSGGRGSMIIRGSVICHWSLEFV